MNSNDLLAEALRRAKLAAALREDTSDVIRVVAARLGLTIPDTRKLAAAMLDAMTAEVNPTIH
jgi:hypothetical protein